jgi:hypothetical protein
MKKIKGNPDARSLIFVLLYRIIVTNKTRGAAATVRIQTFSGYFITGQDFINCAQRQFVKKLLPLYKYTHNVNEGKTCMVFAKKKYGIYERKQSQPELFQHAGRPGGTRQSGQTDGRFCEQVGSYQIGTHRYST